MVAENVISSDELEALSASAGRYLRKVLQSFIGESEAMIPAEGFPDVDEVHDIRVNMKRSRAILKLLRVSTRSDFYTRENGSLRDISSLFSSSREKEVLKKTLRMLSKKYPDLFSDDFSELICEAAEAGFKTGSGEASPDRIASGARELLRRAW